MQFWLNLGFIREVEQLPAQFHFATRKDQPVLLGLINRALADIDPADGLVHVRFTVLPVLQNPGHSLREQPYYYVTISNVTRGTVLASRFNFSNEAGVPWQTNAAGSVVYTDWLLFDLPLSRSAVESRRLLSRVNWASAPSSGRKTSATAKQDPVEAEAEGTLLL